jgi:tRNA pseudouridine32 synthase/23S rRNA pseudouridine746 synthase
VLDGLVKGGEGLIDLPVARFRAPRAAGGWWSSRAARPRHAGQIAEATGGAWSVRPLSGRTHQIRLHASRGLGAAIVGDPVYSLPDDAELGGMTLPDSGMLLHSWRIVVPRDPKDAIDVTAPVPDRFGLWLDHL